MSSATARSLQRFLVFLQAEDGIRDIGVTGVQTCALPISDTRAIAAGPVMPAPSGGPIGAVARPGATVHAASVNGLLPSRSEERRVGKECSSLLSAHHQNTLAGTRWQVAFHGGPASQCIRM